jgi:hypothetical protein
MELKVTRMEFRESSGHARAASARARPGECYSVHGYWLRDGVRAAIGACG